MSEHVDGVSPPRKRSRNAEFAELSEPFAPSPVLPAGSSLPRRQAEPPAKFAVAAQFRDTILAFDASKSVLDERINRLDKESYELALQLDSAAAQFRHMVLPRRASALVFSFLSARDVVSCLCVCRAWRRRVWSFVTRLRLTAGTRRGITDEFLQQLAERAPQLENLDLGYCNLVRNKGLMALWPLVRLTELNLSSATGIDGAESLPACLHHLQGLRSLILRNGLRKSMVDAQARSFSYLPHLESLVLDGCDALTDDMFVALRHCTQLKHLSLVELGKITCTGLLMLAPLRRLESLNLAHCFRVDCSITEVVKQHPTLTELSLCCVRLKLETVLLLEAQFPALDIGLPL